jgi:membrane protein required for colicin V production
MQAKTALLLTHRRLIQQFVEDSFPIHEPNAMQTYDILMLIILASAAIFGAIKGFAWQVASLASIVVSYFVANYFRNDVAKHINAQPPWNVFLAMLLLFFGTSLAIWLIFRMISSTIDKIRLKEFDRQLGAGFGLLKGAAMCCIVTMFAMTLLGPNQKTAIARSKSGLYIAQALAHAGSIMPEEVKQVIGPYIANVERQLEQGRGPEGFPVPVDLQGANGTSLGNDLMRGIGLEVPNSPGNTQSGGQNSGGQGGSAGGILERFLGTSPKTGPATQNPIQYNSQGSYPLPSSPPTGQATPSGATNTWYGNDILPTAPGNQGTIPVLPPLPF